VNGTAQSYGVIPEHWPRLRDGRLRDDLVEFLVARIGDSAIAGDDE
jgi:hypothetical protein